MNIVKSGYLETRDVQTFSYLGAPRKTPWLAQISTSGFQVRKITAERPQQLIHQVCLLLKSTVRNAVAARFIDHGITYRDN